MQGETICFLSSAKRDDSPNVLIGREASGIKTHWGQIYVL